MVVSILIPCYNEARTVQEILRRVESLQIPKEIIVVDDGSDNHTKEILARHQSAAIRVIRHEHNRGKGAAIRTALAHARGDVIAIQDADLEYDPVDLQRLLEPINRGMADVVYGSRFVGSFPHRVMFFWHYLGNRLITLLTNLFADMNLTDVETCYKLFRREILQKITLEENRFGFEVEVTMKVARLKCRIYEMGISYYGRTYDEGKKITWRDGLYALYCIVKYAIKR